MGWFPDQYSALNSVFETLFFFVIDESLKEVSDFINNPMWHHVDKQTEVYFWACPQVNSENIN